METSDLLLRLSAANGPSGHEDGARELIRTELEKYCSEVRSDAMGNLIATRRCGRENAKTIMLDAHMDEIGLIVTGYQDGYLRFGTLGGVDPRMLPASEVTVLTGEPIFGVVDVMPPHALSAEDMDKPLPADKLYIDVGMTQEMVEKAVPLGTPVVYRSPAQLLGEGSVCGKALDNRACCAIIIKTLEALEGAELDFDICCLISTQEELGCRGAIPGAFGLAPDYAIALDVTHGQTPDAPKHEALEVDKGAAIGVGPNCNRALTEAIIETAKAEKLDYQLEVLPGHSGTDAWPIQVSRSGVATALISLPLKYMHTPIEVVRIADADCIISLLTAFLKRAGEVL